MRSLHSLLSLALGLVLAQHAGAMVFTIANGDVAGLKTAITTANSNQQDDVINLAANGSYLLSAADNGTNGLPIVGVDGGHTLTINGNGATISRTGAGKYRLIQVSFATVFVNGVVMQNGDMDPSDTQGDGQFGGAILNDHGNLTVTNCTFMNNHGYDGGALANDASSGNATLAVLNSTFVQNHVGRSGAALFNNFGIFTMTNCTVSDNSGDSGLGGSPGISTFGGSNKIGSGTIVHCTFYRNIFAPSNPILGNSGIQINQSTITISNSILLTADPTLPVIANSNGTVISNGYNIANDDEEGFLNAIGDQTNVDPRLAPLANNGGATQTHALMNGSPALDAGDPNTAVATDQRGQPRPVDSNGDGWNRSDVGAFERQPGDAEPSFVVTSLDDHTDGTCNAADCTLREAMAAANSKGGFPGITFKAGLTGPVNLTSALPTITTNVGIYGPGAKVITVTKNSAAAFRLFNVGNNNLAVTISGLTLSNGNSDHGAAILNPLSTVVVLDCLITGNTDSFGGALYAAGGNQTTGRSFFRLVDCTFSNNSAGQNGGAVYLDGASFGTAWLNMYNCTLSTNSAVGDGGAIFANAVSGSVVLHAFNCTFSGNSAPTGDTLCTDFHNSGVVTVLFENSIFNKPSSGTNFATADGATPPTGYSGGHNISNDNGSGLLTRSGDMINTNPRLDPSGLQDNGGDTPTIALLPNSPFFTTPELNNADTSAPSRDQRGLLRNGAPDIGAFEFNGLAPPMPTPPPTPTATPTATATATVTPAATATAKPTATATATPTATPTAKPTATPTATPRATSTATPTATPTGSPKPGTLGNISTRLQVLTGNNVLFAGFIIQGSASKTVLIRSEGPSLAAFGLPGAMSNPKLELHDANSTIGTNDNWQTTQLGGVITSDQVPGIQNSGAAPADPAEPAIIATLTAGSYTAIVQGVGGTQGVATVEVYDLSPNNGATLANISTRGFIQTGDNVMIGGFIDVGQSSRVLIRATGPSLTAFGINNALANPRIELHDANGTLGGNDDWQTTELGGIITSDQSSAIQNSGLAPSDPVESAIIATLAPGSYTAIAQGVNGGVGVGVIEVFALP